MWYNILDLITLELNKYKLTEKEIKELKSEVINIIDNIP